MKKKEREREKLDHIDGIKWMRDKKRDAEIDIKRKRQKLTKIEKKWVSDREREREREREWKRERERQTRI
jgi:hypothetical protein